MQAANFPGKPLAGQAGNSPAYSFRAPGVRAHVRDSMDGESRASAAAAAGGGHRHSHFCGWVVPRVAARVK